MKALRSCQHHHFLCLMMHSSESKVESNDSLLFYFVTFYITVPIVFPYRNVYLSTVVAVCCTAHGASRM